MPDGHLLRMKQISKSFPGVQALQGVDFDLRAGEVHAIVGENGAGKSTLIKVLAGVHRPDRGTIQLGGRAIQARSPRDMMQAGVQVIYQELNLVPELSVAENLLLGREPRRAGIPGIIHNGKMIREARRILSRFGVPIDPRVRVTGLGVAYQQIVEIARAVSCRAKVVVMDEPTAALTDREREMLFEIIDELRQQGVAVIFISHRLEEIERIADRVTVLRDGRHIVTAGRGELSGEQMIRHMVGRPVEEFYPKEELDRGDLLLEVDRLSCRGACHDVSFQLRRGEILGMAGLAGSGRTEIAECLFGRRKAERGTVRIGGQAMRPSSPRQAIEQGLGLIPEERKSDGLVLEMSVFDNATLPILRRFSRVGVLRRRQLARMVDGVTRAMRIKAVSSDQRVKQLSGGNQQKVVLARWLLRDCRVYIFDEPTRGIDVGAKTEIYRLMEDVARKGAGVLMISSDMAEVLNMSDRVLVVRDGTIAGQLGRRQATQQSIMRLAVGREGEQ